MKFWGILHILLLFILLSPGTAKAQAFTTKGTDFWLTFLENYLDDDSAGTDQMKVYITTDFLPATGTVSIPKAGWSQNYTVQPNSTFEIVLPTALVMCAETDVIENTGVHVTSDNPVSVYQLNYVQYTSDANIIIPTSSLGKRYRVTTYQPSNASPLFTEVSVSELAVVAAYDSTTIRIVPKCNTQGNHGANIPFTITLNQGEVYQIRSYPSASYSLTGSLIEIDTTVANNCKTFAVFAGNKCAFVPGDSCCCNHICEQMMPIHSWGKKYITVPLKTRSSDVFRIVGQKNGTIFTLNGGLPQGLNAGGMYEADLNAPAYISSNYPISVAQFSKSAGNDGNEYSDPFMIMLNPLEQTVNRIVFNSFVTSIISDYYVNIVTRTAYTILVKLDGTSLATSFAPVAANPAYSYAQISVTQGNHILSSDSGLVANVYGYGWYESYGYIAGATVKNLEISFSIITPTDTAQYYNVVDTLCKNTPITFAATFNQYITSYTWDFGDGSPLASGQVVTHTYANPGNYLLRYYYQRSGICGLDSILWPINIKCCNQPPVLQATSPLCVGNHGQVYDTTLISTSANSFWTFGNAVVVSGTAPGPFDVYWTGPGSDSIWVKISEPGCDPDSTFATVRIDPIPTSDFSVSGPLCVGNVSNVQYTGNASDTALYQWTFPGGNIISGSGKGPYALLMNQAGVYNFSLAVTESGCSDTSYVLMEVFPSPQALFTPNPEVAFIEEPLIQFTDQSLNTSQWWWDFGESISGSDNNSDSPSPSHSYAEPGNYTVTLVVTSPEGCKDSITDNVQIIGNNSFYIPNAFTPNNDDVNSIFQPYSTKMSYTLYIFNRWGEQLFVGQDEGWDGKYKGVRVKDDVYVWLLHYSFYSEKPKIASGRVSVIR